MSLGWNIVTQRLPWQDHCHRECNSSITLTHIHITPSLHVTQVITLLHHYHTEDNMGCISVTQVITLRHHCHTLSHGLDCCHTGSHIAATLSHGFIQLYNHFAASLSHSFISVTENDMAASLSHRLSHCCISVTEDDRPESLLHGITWLHHCHMHHSITQSVYCNCLVLIHFIRYILSISHVGNLIYSLQIHFALCNIPMH